MFNWGRLTTRLIILGLTCIALWIGRDPLIRMALIQTAQAKVGAKIEIGKVRSSFRDNKIYLSKVRIADPRDPMKNLLQADTIALKLDREGLLHRRFEIVEGSTTELLFNAPRSNSGKLGSEPSKESFPGTVASHSTRIQLDKPFHQHDWLDQIRMVGEAPNAAKLQLTSTAQIAFSRLENELSGQVAQIEGLKTTVRSLHDTIKFDGNVLRNKDKWENAQTQMSDLRKNIELLARNLTELDQQLTKDRNELVLAKQNDELALMRRKTLNGNTLTRLLLNRSQIDQAKNIVEWYLDFRRVFPDTEADFRQRPKIGANIAVLESPLSPAFKIDSMQLDGEGRIAGSKFNFTGTVNNFSTEPNRMAQPISFSLRAQGNMHFSVTGTLDRRNDLPIDSVLIRCPDFPIKAQRLGVPELLQVGVSPCRSQIEIQLDATGDKLDGTLNFHYDNLVMQIEELAEEIGGKEAADQINLELASISNYEVSAKVNGPVSNPTISFQSDLGDRFAKKFNDLFDDQLQVAKQQLDLELQKQLDHLDRTIGENIRIASQRLETEIVSQEKVIVAEFFDRAPHDPFERSLRR